MSSSTNIIPESPKHEHKARNFVNLSELIYGLHIVVHEYFGPSAKKQLGLENPSTFYADDTIHPSLWVLKKSFYSTEDPVVIVDKFLLRQWYKQSSKEMIINPNDSYTSKCFTIKVESPVNEFSLRYNEDTKKTEDKQDFIERMMQLDSSVVSDFVTMLQTYAEGQYSVMLSNGDIIPIDVVMSKIQKDEDLSGHMVALSNDILKNGEAMTRIMNHKAVQCSIYYFLVNHYRNYDSLFSTKDESIRKHIFIEIIGTVEHFHSAKDNQSIGLHRYLTWKRWVKNIIDNAHQEHVIDACGFYTIQQVPLQPLTGPARIYDYVQSEESYETINSHYIGTSIVLPMFCMLRPVYTSGIEKKPWEEEDEKMFSIEEISHSLRSIISDDEYTSKRIRYKYHQTFCSNLPIFTSQCALNPYTDDNQMSLSDFDWQHNLNKMGSGTFGSVFGISWHSCDESTSVSQFAPESNVLEHDKIFKHIMIVDALVRQRHNASMMEFYELEHCRDAYRKYSSNLNKGISNIVFHYNNGYSIEFDITNATTFSEYNNMIAHMMSIIENSTTSPLKASWKEWVYDEYFTEIFDIMRVINPITKYFVSTNMRLAIKSSLGKLIDRQENLIIQLLTNPQTFIASYYNFEENAMDVEKVNFSNLSGPLVVNIADEEILEIIFAGKVISYIRMSQKLGRIFATNNIVKKSITNLHILNLYGMTYNQSLLITILPFKQNGSLASMLYGVKRLMIDIGRVQRGEMLNMDLEKHKRPLSFFELIRIFSDIIEAILFMNHYQITHMDIKPENILIDENRRGFLGDFSLSQCYGTKVKRWGTRGFISENTRSLKGKQQHIIYDAYFDVYALVKTLEVVFDGDDYTDGFYYYNERTMGVIGSRLNMQMKRKIHSTSNDTTEFLPTEIPIDTLFTNSQTIPVSHCVLPLHTRQTCIPILKHVLKSVIDLTTIDDYYAKQFSRPSTQRTPNKMLFPQLLEIYCLLLLMQKIIVHDALEFWRESVIDDTKIDDLYMDADI